MRKLFEISRVVLLLSLPATLWLISNHYINKHYHVLDNGEVVSHAHPYQSSNDTPFQDHDHCDFDYSILAQISSNSSVEDTFSPEFSFIEFTGNELLYENTFDLINRDNFNLPLLRAPPII